MGQLIETSPRESLPPSPVSLWKARERQSAKGFARRVFSSRAVEFIAQAGMSTQLCTRIDGPVLKFLEKQRGFAGAAVLTTHKEPRRILVLTFWKTERDCLQNEWELADQVQSAVATLIDAFSRVRTYKADFWQPLETGQAVDAAQPC